MNCPIWVAPPKLPWTSEHATTHCPANTVEDSQVSSAELSAATNSFERVLLFFVSVATTSHPLEDHHHRLVVFEVIIKKKSASPFFDIEN